MGTISWDCDKMLRVEKMELTPLSERICGLKLVQIEPRSTHQKEVYVGLPTDSFIGQGRTYDFLWKFRASMRSTREDTRGTHSVLPIH